MRTSAVVSSMKAAACAGVAALMALSVLPCVVGAPYGWSEAHITYYGTASGGGTQGGACGYPNTFAMGYGAMTAALSYPLFQGGKACGGCYQLRCKWVTPTRTVHNWCWSYSRTITVTATNSCPPGSHGGWCNWRPHFDLPMPAFLTLARREGGVAPVYYRKVRCAKRGGIRFTIGGNPYFLMILIHNVGGAGDLKAVKVRGGNGYWVPMWRNWGALWTCKTRMSGALSFQITTGDGRTLTTYKAVGGYWRFGQTWEGSQFR
ncbi:expansin-A4 [Physcomitrium patens]|uniref:Expansin n=2 Tax=Physcomitrium patens TaxID=3218 RepID=A0A2K1JI84_PHYPA|nr:expansin-A4-like [Physcomitrium patens]XP_024394013.1 expansin-A4-like [Physcomitrium patens]PNR41272.1 hypothetical protein PHYPA_018675 [Physcomitrium patens]|eukprot:XP_024393926.1 expansin-A4-like [Physcomitrella patens]